MARMAKVVELPSIAKIDKSKGKISAQLTQALREAVQSGDLQLDIFDQIGTFLCQSA